MLPTWQGGFGDNSTDQLTPGIEPVGWTFAIWGVIYGCLLMFVIYQALPAEYVPDRPDDLIFNQIGGVFILNMILSSFWFTFYFHESTGGYITAQIIIFGMFSTALY